MNTYNNLSTHNSLTQNPVFETEVILFSIQKLYNLYKSRLLQYISQLYYNPKT